MGNFFRLPKWSKISKQITLIALSLTSLSGKAATVEPSASVSVAIPSQHDVGRHACLVLDKDNKRIVYYDKTNGDLRYAYFTGDRWRIQVIDSAGDVGQFARLAIGSFGTRHVVYYDSTKGDLKYAYNGGEGWKVETVDSTGNVGKYVSLDVNPITSKRRIAYYDVTNGDLKYAYNGGEGWKIETVDNGGDVGQHASLVTDALGQRHIAYYDATKGDLKYAVQSGSGWKVQTLDSDGNVGKFASIQVSPLGFARIAYYDATKGDLKYASANSVTGWRRETADDKPQDSGQFASLVSSFKTTDSGDNVEIKRVAYYDETNGNLKYAVSKGGAWSIEIAAGESGMNVGKHASLAVADLDDGSVRVGIAHYDYTLGILRYAERVGGAWTKETVDDGW